MVLSILISCLTSKYEALFASWHFFKMAANESGFDVLYFCQNYIINEENKTNQNKSVIEISII